MRDFAKSDDPAVQAQLDRLAALSLPQGRFGLETIRELLRRLGDPQRALPPVFHVAGTNGKGSTCAFLRAMLEAQGYKVHAATSPHLVRYNERIRIAGKLISDALLAALLDEVLGAAEGLSPSFFEVTAAATFLAFARNPADACVIEVGLGGRFDATNVFEPEVLAACGITALGIDHERFLLAPEECAPDEPMARIAFEKAGIAKHGVPLITQYYREPEANWAIEDAAERAGSPLFRTVGEHRWNIQRTKRGGLSYGDRQGYAGRLETLDLPAPRMHGEHQIENAGLAVAMLRHQRKLTISREAIARGIGAAHWPGRLQRLDDGPLTAGREVWLDGGHNGNAGERLWEFVRTKIVGRRFEGAGEVEPIHLIVGMIEGKDPKAFLALDGPWVQQMLASLTVVPIPGHVSHPVEAFGPMARADDDVESALKALPDDRLPVLIAGSLYLAGEVLRLNGEIPD